MVPLLKLNSLNSRKKGTLIKELLKNLGAEGKAPETLGGNVTNWVC